jgi:DNA-binding NtrC family response regulator
MRKPRVLIFDDEITILQMLESFFTKKGFEVVTYAEPIVCPFYEKSEEHCKQEYPCADLVITDIVFPSGNGIALLHQQAERGCPLNIRKKAVISAHIDDVTQKAIEQIGCAYFKKPFRLSELNTWLNNVSPHIDVSYSLAPL